MEIKNKAIPEAVIGNLSLIKESSLDPVQKLYGVE